MLRSPTWKVYCLFDPQDGELRYVGCTAQALGARIRTHRQVRELRTTNWGLSYLPEERGKSKKEMWIRDLRRRGATPYVVVVSTFHDKKTGLQAERWLINLLITLGYALTNSDSRTQKLARQRCGQF